MDDRIRTTAVAAARQLLQRYRAVHPQWSDDCTPVDDIVAWLGLYVETFHPYDYPQGTYGFLEPNEDLIWLCRDLPETLRRFTLLTSWAMLCCMPRILPSNYATI